MTEEIKDAMIGHQHEMKGKLAVEESNWRQKQNHCRTSKYIKVMRGGTHKARAKWMMWKAVFKKLHKMQRKRTSRWKQVEKMTDEKVWKQRSNIQIKGILEAQQNKTKPKRNMLKFMIENCWNKGISDVPGKIRNYQNWDILVKSDSINIKTLKIN